MPPPSARAIDVARRDDFRVIDDPVQAVERHFAVHLFVDVEYAGDALVVRGVDAERPALFGEEAHHLRQLAFQCCRQVGAGLAEVFEVRRREHQHLARAVVAQQIVALAGSHHLRPALEVGQFLALLLGEKVVGDAHRQLPVGVQLLDDPVVLWIVLEAAAGIDHRGDAQSVELAHEVPRGVELVLGWQLRSHRQRGVQDQGVGFGQQQAGGISGPVALDLAARRVRRVLGIAHSAQGGAIEQGAVVLVQDEDGRVGCRGVQLIQRGQTFFGELRFAETVDHAHPLGRRRDGDLRPQHRHRVGERAHAVPAQFQVVVQAAADQVGVAVVETGHQPAPAGIDDACVFVGMRHHLGLVADRQHAAIGEGDRASGGQGRVERDDARIAQDQVGHAGISGAGITGQRRERGGRRHGLQQGAARIVNGHAPFPGVSHPWTTFRARSGRRSGSPATTAAGTRCRPASRTSRARGSAPR